MNRNNSSNNKRFRGTNSTNNRRNNNRPSRKTGAAREQNRNFPKFVDYHHVENESNCWPQNHRNTDNNRLNNVSKEPPVNAGIYPWIRKKPVDTLIMPQHIKFNQHSERNQQDASRLNNDTSNKVKQIENRTPEINNSVNQKTDIAIKIKQEKDFNLKHEKKSSSSSSSSSSSESDSNTEKGLNEMIKATHRINEVNNDSKCVSSASPVKTGGPIKIKQEKELPNLKQKKNSSSSSSSSESSSSESEVELNKKPAMPIKPLAISDSKISLLDVKLKPRSNLVSSISVKTPQKLKPVPEKSSSSSSSSEEERTPHDLIKAGKKEQNANSKISSEDDVVCVGNLENKIVLEDESEKSSSTEEECDSETAATILNNLSKKTEKINSEKCMICDKKNHTSFQCQMICKNCSEPYHGYRTCPHPANLNTMIQLFMEFCMQQLQHFQAEKQASASTRGNVSKPKVDATNLMGAINKSNKLKRKQIRTSETTKNHRKSKKRKLSASKKTKSKINSSKSGDDNSDDDDSDAKTSSTENDDNSSDSSAETIVSSRKKRKLNNKNASKAALNLASSSANALSLPMVLNGFPHLAVPTTSVQNPNTSANALNTLFLTQMFQNAIESLKK